MKQIVRPVWITPQPENVIVYCARVSSGKQDTEEKEKLLKYLTDNKHWSPFEMASMCVEIVTSRAIGRQILRHRSFSFQEFSQRYATVQEFIDVEPRLQSEKNRQGSKEGITHLQWEFAKEVIGDVERYVSDKYNLLLKEGIAKEVARFVLPGSSLTRMYMAGTVRSWIHYCQLRCKENVQEEHREIAEAIREILLENVPSLREILWQQ